MEYKKVQEKLYDYSAGIFCGVLLPEKVMKKLVKLNANYMEEIRKVLLDNKDVLYASNWTLANTKNKYGKIGKQIYLRYVKMNDKEELERRIKLFKVAKPKYEKDVYIVEDYKEADKIVEDILAKELEAESQMLSV